MLRRFYCVNSRSGGRTGVLAFYPDAAVRHYLLISLFHVEPAGASYVVVRACID